MTAVFLYQGVELVVYHILKLVIDGVVQMEVLECVDVEVHLVVVAHPVMVDSQKGKLGEDVVDGCDGDLCLPGRQNLRRDHVRAGMAQSKHGLMNGQALRGDFQSVAFQQRFEFLYRGSFVDFVHL